MEQLAEGSCGVNKMNKKGGALMLIIIILVVLALGWFLLGNSDDAPTEQDTAQEVEQETDTDEIPETEYDSVDTTDDILGEIDSSLDYFE